MKNLLLILIGIPAIPIGFIFATSYGWPVSPGWGKVMLVAGVISALVGLVGNHRDHLRR